tara:strand:+ start:334 stop:747 length:414 start_codon:yes stop_codon:yes gene_type:complete
MSRPEWNKIWMEFAHSIARRSYDPRFQVGSVVITEDNSQVLAIGYNGDHKGGPNEVDSVEPGKSGFIHAEINALIKMDYNNPKPKKMYLTLSPCVQCARAIINGGIKKVFFDVSYRDLSGIELLKQNGVEVVCLGDN